VLHDGGSDRRRGEADLKKVGFLLAFGAAVALIGCGGGGGHHNGGNAGNNAGQNAGANGDSVAVANLQALQVPNGQVNVSYLPRQGRALETFIAQISRFDLLQGEQIVSAPLAPFQFPLNGSEVQNKTINVPTGFGADARVFDSINVDIDQLTVDQGGGPEVIAGANGQPLFAENFAANIRVFPDRETGVQLFLNDGMIDLSVSPPVFRDDVFEFANFNPNDNKVDGFLADYVEFDISGLGASRPALSGGNGTANRIYVSGDRVGLSAAGPGGFFEVLTQDASIRLAGNFVDPTNIGGGTTKGTYRLVSPDPNDPDPFNPAKITALFGSWRPFYDPNTAGTAGDASAFSATGQFEVLTFPTTADNATQQIVIVQSDATHHITGLWIGNAFLDTGHFSAFPLTDFVDGTAGTVISGNLSGFKGVGGVSVNVPTANSGSNVREGRYAFTSNPLPLGFKTTGRFVVYRR
jgi:hypothetical protein